MPNAPTEGNTWSIAAATSSFDANIISSSGLEKTRESIESSHLGTSGGKTFFPAKLVDNGELSMTIEFDADLDVDALIAAASETWTITWPIPSGQTTAATWAFTAFVTSTGNVSVENDSKITQDVTLKISGNIVTTPSS